MSPYDIINGWDGLAPECPFCTSYAVVPAHEDRKTWWCNSCSSEFDNDGEVVIEDEDDEL